MRRGIGGRVPVLVLLEMRASIRPKISNVNCGFPPKLARTFAGTMRGTGHTIKTADQASYLIVKSVPEVNHKVTNDCKQKVSCHIETLLNALRIRSQFCVFGQ